MSPKLFEVFKTFSFGSFCLFHLQKCNVQNATESRQNAEMLDSSSHKELYFLTARQPSDTWCSMRPNVLKKKMMLHLKSGWSQDNRLRETSRWNHVKRQFHICHVSLWSQCNYNGSEVKSSLKSLLIFHQHDSLIVLKRPGKPLWKGFFIFHLPFYWS